MDLQSLIHEKELSRKIEDVFATKSGLEEISNSITELLGE